MTNEEAKRQLESAYPYLSNEIKLALDKATEALGDCYIIPKNSTWIIDGVDVLEAIEKQIPKKPTCEDYSYWCQVCECQVDNKDTWCPTCGQRLEWE